MFEFSKLTCGDPSHPPLIFLHGFLGAKEDWEAALSFFQRRFFCIALDLPGHGSTPYSEHVLADLKTALEKTFSEGIAKLPAPEKSMILSQFAKVAERPELRRQGHTQESRTWRRSGKMAQKGGFAGAGSFAIPSSVKPILIGYSMGGRIALQLQECASAIIALSSHPGLVTKKEKEERRRVDEMWREKLLELPFDAFFTEWYAQPIFQSLPRHPSLLQAMVKRRMRQNPQDLARVLQQLSLANQPSIAHFHCPTLFLHGEEDLKYQQLYCRLPKTVSVRSIKNCTHAIHLENAQGCAEEILNWLDNPHE